MALLEFSSSKSLDPQLFLCEEEILTMVKEGASQKECEKRFEFQQPLAVVWNESGDTKKWYVGFVMSEEEDTAVVDHLERNVPSSSKEWKRPSLDDVQSVNFVQVIPCVVNGEWNFSGRIAKFCVSNYEDIDIKFNELF